MGGEHIKNELKRLGLKCGGTLKDRAHRLWDIKLDPRKLFDPKFLAKKSWIIITNYMYLLKFKNIIYRRLYIIKLNRKN